MQVPPKIREMIHSGALFVVNHSAGKDSQAMMCFLKRIVPQSQLMVVHADLGKVEWPGVQEHSRRDRCSLHSPFRCSRRSYGASDTMGDNHLCSRSSELCLCSNRLSYVVGVMGTTEPKIIPSDKAALAEQKTNINSRMEDAGGKRTKSWRRSQRSNDNEKTWRRQDKLTRSRKPTPKA